MYNLNLDRCSEVTEGKNIVMMNALSDATQSTDLLRSFQAFCELLNQLTPQFKGQV